MTARAPGDEFLKYLASIYVFVTCPSMSEGALHIERQKIISNKSLLTHATRVELPSFIQSKVFAYKTWLPPNFRVYVPPKAPKEHVTTLEPTAEHPIQDDKEDQEGGDIKQANPEASDIDIGAHAADAHPQPPAITDGSPMIISSTRTLDQSNIPNAEPGEIIEEDSFSDTGPADQDVLGSRPTTPPALPDAINSIAAEPAPQEAHTQTPPKKKVKPRNKKAKSDEKGIQYLGDKVPPFF